MLNNFLNRVRRQGCHLFVFRGLIGVNICNRTSLADFQGKSASTQVEIVICYARKVDGSLHGLDFLGVEVASMREY